MWLTFFGAFFMNGIESHCRVAIKLDLQQLPFKELERSSLSILSCREKFGLGGERAIVSNIYKVVRQLPRHGRRIVAQLRFNKGTTCCFDFRHAFS